MKPNSSFFSVKIKYAFLTLCLFVSGYLTPVKSDGQTNLALTAVASQSSGGITIYSPANYNDNVIVAWTGCSGYGTCPLPWGWVFDMGWINYTWATPQTFNKVVFYFADRPMNSCMLQYWNGSSYVNIVPYTTAICNADSITFPAVTTTILRFNNCTAPLINPNFREIQVWQSGPPPPTITGATHYCNGSTVTLTATSTATSPTFTWSGPSAFTATTATISFTASPATAGVYSCTVTSGGFTSTAALDTIVVVPPPSITTGTVTAVCQGVTSAGLPYTATGTPTTYSIVYSPAAIAAGFVNVTSAVLPASPITITVPAGVAAGAYTGTITVANALCASAGVPFSVPINPNPAPITGVTNICTGSISTLTDATGGGTWTSSITTVATIGSSTGIVNGLTVGSTTVVYTLPTGCSISAPVNVVGISGADHVCAGDSVTLSVTSTGGAWSTSNTTVASIGSASGVITGVAMGVVQVSYTLPTGCIALWAFTVNPLAPILGRDSVCVLSNRYLTNIVGGGTWTSDITAVATVLPDSGKVTGVAAGITTISYLLPTGCLSTVSFTVVNYPGAIAGTKHVCPGTTTTLTNATGGGVWSTKDASVATVDPSTGVVTGVVADTVDIVYTIQPGCPVQTKIIVNPLPAPVTGPSVVCPGTVDTMRDATRGGLWSSGSTSVITVVDTDGYISALAGGTSVIQYQLPTGCLQTKTVSVNQTPAPTIFYNYLLNTFFATPGFATYQWYDSSQGKIPGATTPSLAAAQTMYYWVEVTDSNGCKGVSPYYHFDVNSVGIKNYLKSTDVKIYPNPATAMLYITSPVKVRVTISSMDGKQEIDEADAKAIDISQLANGIYMVAVYDEEGVRVTVQKLVKE